MRESPNGLASASQADSRGFDSRLSLQKEATAAFATVVSFWNRQKRTTSAVKFG